jgi:putative ABC transport system permease protein
MIKNYLKIAWRNLWRNKFFSFINIIGLALGMACSILILLWVENELSIDTFHSKASRLYIIFERQYYDNKIVGQYSVPGLLANVMKKEIPEIEYAANFGFNNNDDNTFRVGDKILKLEGSAADSDFFKMFSYPLLEGNAENALNTPLSIAISRKMAEDFFGSPQAAIGKTILYGNRKNFTITAVFENLPLNTSRKFEYLLNWDNFLKENDWAKQWNNNGPQAYILLRADANPALVAKKIVRFLDKYNKEQSNAFREELGMQKFGEIYLHSYFTNGKPDDGRIEYVHLFSIVAIFVLLIACINFMNLTTARSVKRAKEIGVRKAVGAVRAVLIRQFIGEAILITFIAVFLSILLVLIFLPVFNSLTQKQISYPFSRTTFWLWLFGLAIITGILSGSYPALFLSAFNPVKVLKGTVKLSTGSAWFRKGLVVFQFVLSVALIVGTIVISNQVNYIQTKNLGFDRDNLIYIPMEGDLVLKYPIFKEEALKMPGIKSISRISNSPTNFGSSTGDVKWEGKDPNISIEFTQIDVGYDLVPTLKLRMAYGRDYSRDFATDTSNYMINETALKRIGYTDPIGKPLTMWGKKGKIIGVLADFHFNSLHEPIYPLIVRLKDSGPFGTILVRTLPGQTKIGLAGIEKLCRELNPNFTFSYAFSDEEYQKLYNNEQVVGKLSNVFAFLAIFISSMGLLGLAMFTAEQRIKEIGIRKVLGASIISIFTLLSSEFLILILVAILIAVPIAWYAMDKWLQGFAYHITVQWWMFVLSGGLITLIALLTVSFQALKSAVISPVKSLRSE